MFPISFLPQARALLHIALIEDLKDSLPADLAQPAIAFAGKAREALHALVKEHCGYEIGDTVRCPGWEKPMVVDGFFLSEERSNVMVRVHFLKKDGTPSKRIDFFSLAATLLPVEKQPAAV